MEVDRIRRDIHAFKKCWRLKHSRPLIQEVLEIQALMTTRVVKTWRDQSSGSGQSDSPIYDDVDENIQPRHACSNLTQHSRPSRWTGKREPFAYESIWTGEVRLRIRVDLDSRLLTSSTKMAGSTPHRILHSRQSMPTSTAK